MTSTGISTFGKENLSEKHGDISKTIEETSPDIYDPEGSTELKAVYDNTHRKLRPRHIQLIGIGGTIGTALFVAIGKGLLNGGPANLFMAFTIWCTFILAITNCMAEMVTYMPISSPFIRLAGRWIEESVGFAAGWNFFIFEAFLVPFEITAINVILKFWTTAIPVWAVIIIVLILYAALNLFAVQWYGESEFWLALGKVLLAVGLIAFTFIAMLGGNPIGDRYGFRFWYDPGSFAEYYTVGNLGRFMGFLSCLIQAAFTVAGPDYVSLCAGEVENPRKVLPRVYNSVFYRLLAFFSLGALCVGINVPYTSEELTDAFKKGLPGAAASPYVVAMNRLKISVLPHIVNALILTACFSAGNSYVYCSSRSLYGLALEGKAPKIFTRCAKNGVPVYTVLLTLAISLLAFLSLAKSSSVVLDYFISLITASQLINFSVMAYTYIAFYNALKAQGISRDSLPHKGWLQPYAAWYGFIGCFIMAFVGGYEVFLPGKWDLPTFFFSYTMIFVCPILFVGHKIIKRTRWVKPEEADLRKDLDEIEDYERSYAPQPVTNPFVKALDWLFG